MEQTENKNISAATAVAVADEKSEILFDDVSKDENNNRPHIDITLMAAAADDKSTGEKDITEVLPAEEDSSAYIVSHTVKNTTEDTTLVKDTSLTEDTTLVKDTTTSSAEDTSSTKETAVYNKEKLDKFKEELDKILTCRYTISSTDNYDFFVNSLMYYMSVFEDLIENEKEKFELNKSERYEEDFRRFRDRYHILSSKFFSYFVLDSKFSFIDFIEYIGDFNNKWNKNLLMNMSVLNNLDLCKIYDAYKECLADKKENAIADISNMLKSTKKLIYKATPISTKEEMIYVFKNEDLIKYDNILKLKTNMGETNYNKYISEQDDKFISRKSLENSILDYIYSSSGIFTDKQIGEIIYYETIKKDGIELIKTFDTKKDLIYTVIKCCTLISEFFGERNNSYFNSKYPDFYTGLNYVMLRMCADVDFKFIHYFIAVDGIGKSKWIKDLFGDRNVKTQMIETMEMKKHLNPKVYKKFIKTISEYDFIREALRNYHHPKEKPQEEIQKEAEEKEKKNFISREPNGKAIYMIDVDKLSEIIEKFKNKLSPQRYDNFKAFLKNLKNENDKSISIGILNEQVKLIYTVMSISFFGE